MALLIYMPVGYINKNNSNDTDDYSNDDDNVILKSEPKHGNRENIDEKISHGSDT